MSYWGLESDYVHQIVNHVEEYVRGNVNTNGMENLWSLLKRGLNGTYVSVERLHLFRHIDEQAFRFNNRATREEKITDSDRVSLLCSQIVGKRLTYGVDGEGRPIGLWDGTLGKSVWWGTTYGAASQPNRVEFYNGDGEAFTWSGSSLLMSSWNSTVGSKQQTGSLDWNPNGTLQILQINDSTTGQQDTQTCTYGYDDLARLGSVNCGSGGWGQNFSYDAFSNITKAQSGTLGTNFQPGYGTGNHVLGFSYDGNGNVTNDGSNSYSYNVEGRPMVVDGSAVIYDAFDRPVEVGGSPTPQILYSPDGFKFAYMNGQNLSKYIAPLGGGAQAVYTAMTPAPPSYWRHTDWLGSVRLASNANQTVFGSQAYAPFGESYETGQGTSALSDFTGQTQDTAAGIYDFLFRQYSPTQGRWLVPDPAGLAAVDITNPQTWNRYAYVANNPLANKDPLGLYCAVGIACSQGGGSYDAFAGTGPGGVYAAGGGGGSGFAYGGQAGSDPCGGWCSPPSSLLGNITASQDAFGEQMYQQWEQQALLDLALQAAANQAATANCIATGLQSTFGASSVTAGTSTGEVGGHWNFNFQLSFSSYDAASAFTSVYQATWVVAAASALWQRTRSSCRKSGE